MNDMKPAGHLHHDLAHRSAAHWEALSRQRALHLFQEAARRVPAYQDHLHRSGIDPSKVTSFEAFEDVPPISKRSYLRAYPLKDLCWDGTLSRPLVFGATSGTTGEPFYFPRSASLGWQSSWIHEMFLRHGSRGQPVPTLVLVCFGLGVWIAGLISYQGFEIAARRGRLPVSILTPGINKAEILNALRRLSPQFEQTILVGYPPFLKDVVDAATAEGIALADLRLRFSFAAEPFTEDFRDYLAQAAGSADPCLDTLNIYGSSDIGAMASETPLSIAIRRCATAGRAAGAPQLFEAIFGATGQTPTLAQFNPMFVTFEALAGELLVTGNSALPLVRYAIGDHGRVTSHGDMVTKLEHAGTSLTQLCGPAWPGTAAPALPFVHVRERTDSSTTLYGLQIYPAPIRDALIQPSVARWVTGHFAMATRFDSAQNQFLEINLEACSEALVDPEGEEAIRAEIVTFLARFSSEYRELLRVMADRAWPRLRFWPPRHPKYFAPVSKRRWVTL